MITYLRRALKYFIQITIIFAVIIGILMLTNMASKDINTAFRHGWQSVQMILGAFAVMSLIYPLFGYGKRTIRAEGEPSEHKAAIDAALQERGYVPAGDAPEACKYHLSSPVSRAARLWDDTITITPVLGGFEAEGLMRDLARVVSSINHKIHYND